MSKYTFGISEFLNDKVDPGRVTQEIGASSITIALDHIDVDTVNCDFEFKTNLTSAEQATLSGIVIAHSGLPLLADQPYMADGRPIVRADTRPLGTQTWFSSSGDCELLATCTGIDSCRTCEKGPGIGSGKSWMWNFAEDEDWYDPNTLENPIPLASGTHAKWVQASFAEPVYTKDGTLYFLDATYGSFLSMFITVPSGNYYPNPSGPYPAAALGLTNDDKMYAYASKDVIYICYVNRQYMLGDCPMGDELNSEGVSVDPIPTGWYISGLIVTDEDNTSLKGHGTIEFYRESTSVLPGGAWNGEYADET